MAFLTCAVFLAAFAYYVGSAPPPPPSQPIEFSHKRHVGYFLDGRHRQSMVSMHKGILEERYLQNGEHRQSMLSMHEELFVGSYFREGRHGRLMIAMHEELLRKKTDDEETIGMIMETVADGQCRLCHFDFDKGTENLSKLRRCADCHGTFLLGPTKEEEELVGLIVEKFHTSHCRLCHGDFDEGCENVSRLRDCGRCHGTFHDDGKTEAKTEIVGMAVAKLEKGRCEVCHGDFDRGCENLPRLNRCAACHRGVHDHDWEGREDVRPCMGCHGGIMRSPQRGAQSDHAALPSTNTCAACHPLEGEHEGTDEEMKLVGFIEQKKVIPWTPVYDYLRSEIVFSHERHALLGGVKCQECHGRVGQAQRPVAREMTLNMEDCMSCHESSGVSNDCLTCHR